MVKLFCCSLLRFAEHPDTASYIAERGVSQGGMQGRGGSDSLHAAVWNSQSADDVTASNLRCVY